MNDLYGTNCTKILELFDEQRDLPKGQRTEEEFLSFQTKFLHLVKLLSKDLDQFKAIVQWNDFSDMTFEQYSGPNACTSFGLLISDFVKLVGRECIVCNMTLLSVVNGAWSSVNLDHGERDDKNGKNPIKIAQREGAIALREAVKKHYLTVQCGCCHDRDEDAHPDRGNDDIENYVNFMPKTGVDGSRIRTMEVSTATSCV